MSAHLAAVPEPESDLDRLAREARSEHQAAERAFETSVEHAVRCGNLLDEAEGLCRHGEWSPWLDEVGILQRTANRYMKVARKLANQANLPPTITDALEALEAVDQKRGREHRAKMKKLADELDRRMMPPPKGERYDPIPRRPDPDPESVAEVEWRRALRHSQTRLNLDASSLPPLPPDATTTRARAVERVVTLRETADCLEERLAQPPEDPRPAAVGVRRLLSAADCFNEAVIERRFTEAELRQADDAMKQVRKILKESRRQMSLVDTSETES